jgi:hypothetical protein
MAKNYDNYGYEDDNGSSLFKKILIFLMIIVSIVIIIFLLKGCGKKTSDGKDTFDYEKVILSGSSFDAYRVLQGGRSV